MNESVLPAIVGALVGAAAGGLITYLATGAQLRVMRGQLAAARTQAYWPMIEPAIHYFSQLLTRSALDDPSAIPGARSDIFRGLELIFTGPKVREIGKLHEQYIAALRDYMRGGRSREETEALRQKTVEAINSLIGIPL